MTPWYKYSDKVKLPDNGLSGYESGKNDAQSNEISIPAWETGTIVSWYIPRFDLTDEYPYHTSNEDEGHGRHGHHAVVHIAKVIDSVGNELETKQ